MPELPEVETTRRGITPHIINQQVSEVIIRQAQLRWPISANLATDLTGLTIHSINRRGKYLLLETESGTVLIHLGMSGNLRIVNHNEAVAKHDHADIVFNKAILRFNDPRRFGSILWTRDPVHQHRLLKSLGPEPLNEDFDGQHLYQLSRGRSQSVKAFIMDSHIVVGVGNIYANEALFKAGIHPKRQTGRIALKRYCLLSQCIKEVLSDAITQGGTTLRDFVGSDGKPGYFKQHLNVYGRADMPCPTCLQPLKLIKQANRATVFCRQCQR
jgi:formamidopyrimidine-DNA glycosylase